MFHRVIFLVLLIHLPHKMNSFRTCVPNTSFIVNGRLCYCNYQGSWTDANCKTIARRQSCQPGQIIWQGCKKCTCKVNGQFHCTNTYCYTNDTKSPSNPDFSEYSARCTPFRSYYINCSLCICPASGKTSDARCSIDKSCHSDSHTTDIASIAKMKHCIPNVMYLYPCIQCLCSKDGVFDFDKCSQKCQMQINNRKCVAGTLYKNNCNICRCPNNSVPNGNVCIKADCISNSKYMYLNSLRSTSKQCVPRTFTKPICLYCECYSNGTANENSCLELNCSKTYNLKNHSQRKACSPGELVPICLECFCLDNGQINETYCTRNCSYQNKLNVLKKVLNDSQFDLNILDKSKFKKVRKNNTCEPNTVYLNDNRYCICPNNNDRDSKSEFCTYVIDHSEKVNRVVISENIYRIDTNASCEPNTLVHFNCNTCYCTKNGKIDPKWCTYDDCEAKKIIEESHKTPSPQNLIENPNGTCTPGSISKVKCNFCICPESGLLKDRACTKNSCYDNIEFTDDKFTCEPLAYYEVDCNICYCPHDGLKNVDKCTKNQCEKSFLRTNACLGGQLFSDECKVCVCPPNGNKADKVCTNNTCGILPWNTFTLTKSLLTNRLHDDTTRNLDLCFSGEEFVRGCDLCVCPELGLKMYAKCESILCDDLSQGRNAYKDLNMNTSKNLDTSKETIIEKPNIRERRDVLENCFIYNVSHSAERKECTPGSMYIIRCRQCICPYVGNINNFCRPLPKTFYCEEAYPGFNYMSMGRRNLRNESTIRTKIKMMDSEENPLTVTIKHLNHTIHKCENPGQVTDECFICQCENGYVIEEHCYKSDSKNCINAKPTFSIETKVDN